VTAGELAAGEQVLLIDTKGRRYLVRLAAGGEFHSHAGVLPHDRVIGEVEGCRVATTRGQRFRVLRPTLSDFVLSMPRGAQVIYPKDLGPILLLADLAPGVRVLESGVGSGALSMTMLRAGAHIIGYELREDFAARARHNVETFLGPEVLDRYQVEIRDAYDGIDEVVTLRRRHPGRAEAGPHARGAPARDQGTAGPGRWRRTRSWPTPCARPASTSRRLREEVEKLTQPPSAYGTYARPPTTTAPSTCFSRPRAARCASRCTPSSTREPPDPRGQRSC
jgi:hypothetical protein